MHLVQGVDVLLVVVKQRLQDCVRLALVAFTKVGGRSKVQRRLASQRLRVRVGAALEEQLHAVQLEGGGGAVQRRPLSLQAEHASALSCTKRIIDVAAQGRT